MPGNAGCELSSFAAPPTKAPTNAKKSPRRAINAPSTIIVMAALVTIPGLDRMVGAAGAATCGGMLGGGGGVMAGGAGMAGGGSVGSAISIGGAVGWAISGGGGPGWAAGVSGSLTG